ncbi:MAG: nucleoside deaminase [Bacilli bacterium]|nr:nucleoside deaminase [Bacilli bacterium]
MNNRFFDIAFKEAQKAFELNEVPVGAVIVKDGKILAKAHNMKEKKNCSIYHAEIQVIQKATRKLNNWRLDGCELYVTLDPCPMCASAIKQSRIKCVYSALNNLDENNIKIIQKIFHKDKINPEVIFESNLDIVSSKEILNSFFKKQRNS